MSVNSKMTAIADQIRTLQGGTGKLGLDAMAAQVGAANSTVTAQSSLISQIASALEGKAKSTLPNGYIALDYIAGTGTQYVNIGYSPQSDDVLYECWWVEPTLVTGQTLFGSTDTSSTTAKWSGVHYHSSAGTIYSATGTSDSRSPVSTLVSAAINHMRTRIADGRVTITCNGSASSTSNGYSGSIVNGVNIALLGNQQSDGSAKELCSARIYRWLMYDAGELVRDLQPAMSASGEVGMYDFVTEQFFTNSGTGTLGYGRYTYPSKQ